MLQNNERYRHVISKIPTGRKFLQFRISLIVFAKTFQKIESVNKAFLF